MIHHTDLGSTPFARLRALTLLIRQGSVTVGGHRPGKLYGRLDCRTGKRMKPENQVFFQDELEAVQLGYRPCALCLPVAYRVWRESHR